MAANSARRWVVIFLCFDGVEARGDYALSHQSFKAFICSL